MTNFLSPFGKSYLNLGSLLLLFAAIFLTLGFNSCKKNTGKTANGYDYVIHTRKSGPTPKPGDVVTYHVRHRSEDLVTYASRDYQKLPFAIMLPDFATMTSRASPIMDLLQVMSEGDSATVEYPLANVKLRPRGYETATTIAYDVVLVQIETDNDKKKAILTQQEAQAKGQVETTTKTQLEEQEEAARIDLANKTLQAQVGKNLEVVIDSYKAGELPGLKTTASGLKVYILDEGKGVQAKPGQQVSVHYYGALMSKQLFDSSFGRGAPLNFQLGTGKLIRGWEEGIPMLRVGANAVFFVPPALAYGAQGYPRANIPPNAELVFYVSLLDAD
jgi:FKBP-type peptidyl-prolyl cis-trans isomerase FkpA